MMETELTGFRPHASTPMQPSPQHGDQPMDPIRERDDLTGHFIHSSSTSPYQRAIDVTQDRIPPHHTLVCQHTEEMTPSSSSSQPVRSHLVMWLTLIAIGQLLSLFITGMTRESIAMRVWVWEWSTRLGKSPECVGDHHHQRSSSIGARSWIWTWDIETHMEHQQCYLKSSARSPWSEPSPHGWSTNRIQMISIQQQGR